MSGHCDLGDIQEAAVGDIHQSSEAAAPLQPGLKPFHFGELR
jgi:hypothetical protein